MVKRLCEVGKELPRPRENIPEHKELP